MSHSNYRELMAASLDAPLAEAERADLAAHLESCEACRSVWEALVGLEAMLAAAPERPAPAGFAARLAERLAGRTSRRRVVGGGLILAVSAAVLVALAAVPLAALLILLVGQPDLVIALARAVAAMIEAFDALGGGLWLAFVALLNWSAGQPLVGALAVATLPLAWLWLFLFRKLSPKAVSI